MRVYTLKLRVIIEYEVRGVSNMQRLATLTTHIINIIGYFIRNIPR